MTAALKAAGGDRLDERNSWNIKRRRKACGVLLREGEPDLDLIEGRDLREGIGKQAAEACCHLVSYVREVRQVGGDLLSIRSRGGSGKRGKAFAHIL